MGDGGGRAKLFGSRDGGGCDCDDSSGVGTTSVSYAGSNFGGRFEGEVNAEYEDVRDGRFPVRELARVLPILALRLFPGALRGERVPLNLLLERPSSERGLCFFLGGEGESES